MEFKDLFFFYKKRIFKIYLRERERARAEGEEEGEAVSSLSGKPDANAWAPTQPSEIMT